MSKGSNFWGTARGKLGNMVISSVKGQQVERKYQPQVANPKTFAQMRQRAVFALAVKFFKHSQQNLFKFAFEDKTQRESDYNAFMRHNIRYFTTINKVSCDNPTLPALGFWPELQLSFGSLPSPDAATQFFLLDSSNPRFGLAVGNIHEESSVTKYTWGEVSAAFIKKFGLADGDIITFVVVNSHMSKNRYYQQLVVGDDAGVNSTPATWTIEQKRLSTTSEEDVSNQIISNNSFAISIDPTESPKSIMHFGSIIFSRNIKGRALMVSTSTFTLSDGEYTDVLVTEGSEEEQNVLLTWGANPEAVLKGSLL